MRAGDLSTFFPEVTLTICALAAVLFGVFSDRNDRAPALLRGASALLAFLAFWIALQGGGRAFGFDGMLVDDALSRFAKVTALLSVALILVMSSKYMADRGLLRFEYPVLVGLGSLGMAVTVSANDLIVLFIGIETQGLAMAALAGFRRNSTKSTEAGVKTLLLGAVSSAVLLYGISLVYGVAGSTRLGAILNATEAGAPTGLMVGMVFVTAGIVAKLMVVPFHAWVPDTFEGAPTPITALFATVPVVTMITALARIAHDAFGGAAATWQGALALLGLASLLVAGLSAIGQTNIKRLLAYVAIGNVGLALVGLASGTAAGVSATLLHLGVSTASTVGVFAFVLAMERDGVPVVRIAALSQYAVAQPLKALAMLVLLLTLAGAPPLLGFFVRFQLLLAVADADLLWLAIIAALVSVFASVALLKVVYLMYFGEEEGDLDTVGAPGLSVVLVVTAAAMVAGIVSLFGLDVSADVAASALVN